MDKRFDITNDASVSLPSKAEQLAQQPKHTTSRLGLLIVGLVASCALAIGFMYYWQTSIVLAPTIYGSKRDVSASEEMVSSSEITESNFEAELAEIELDFQETEAELDMSLDEIDAELEAQFDAQ
jgi:hypothetical protein